jgi:integrase
MTWWLMAGDSIVRIEVAGGIERERVKTTIHTRRYPMTRLQWSELEESYDRSGNRFVLRLQFDEEQPLELDSLRIEPSESQREAVRDFAGRAQERRSLTEQTGTSQREPSRGLVGSPCARHADSRRVPRTAPKDPASAGKKGANHMGEVFRPMMPNGELSPNWHIRFYDASGRRVHESTRTTSQRAAERVLKEREGCVVRGEPILRRADKITYTEAAADLRAHYRTTGSRDPEEAEKRLKHLDGFFTRYRIAGIGGAEASAYVEHRRAHGVQNGTINRELSVLTRMLRLAAERNKLLRVPVIRKLKEAPPRSGFLEREQFAAVCRHLPDDVRVAVTIGYALGWRVQEVLGLERRHVDLERGTLTLDPGSTKNGEGRLAYMPPDLKVAVAGQLARVDVLQRKLGRIVPYLFANLHGARQPNPGRRRVPVLGERRGDFKKSWATACKKAGAPGLLRHDMRRSAVRNMVRAGVPERVAMSVTGHKTRSVFDRYNITSPADLQDVARRLNGTTWGLLPSDSTSARLTPAP